MTYSSQPIKQATPQSAIDAFIASGGTIKTCATNVAGGIKLRNIVSLAQYKAVTAEQRAARA